MSKTILITGSTDGIGLETAGILVERGHTVLIHGRSEEKVEKTKLTLLAKNAKATIYDYVADLSDLSDVRYLAEDIADDHEQLDVLINNAGVFRSPKQVSAEGYDIRFIVNSIAPYLLTKHLLTRLKPKGRVVNLSSAAQSPVNLQALRGQTQVPDEMSAYAQSKLALTMWSNHLAKQRGENDPIVFSVNPGSMLGSKMVREGFGVAGNDIRIGATAVVRATLDAEFSHAAGKYFDNDIGRFGSPHPDALNPEKCAALAETIEDIIA